VFDKEEDWCSLIKQRQFGHFHKVSFGIKICYGSAERGYGGGGRIRLNYTTSLPFMHLFLTWVMFAHYTPSSHHFLLPFTHIFFLIEIKENSL